MDSTLGTAVIPASSGTPLYVGDEWESDDAEGYAAWADRVVRAWARRKSRSFLWNTGHDWPFLSAESRDGSIFLDGDCLVTRAKRGFVAVVNGKRFRRREKRVLVRSLVDGIARTGMETCVIRPPYVTMYGVDAARLAVWHDAVREWRRLDAAGLRARYQWIAGMMVDGFTGLVRVGRYNDGYFMAEATTEGIVTASGMILIRQVPEARFGILSARAFAEGSYVRLLRDAVKEELDRRKVPYRSVRPVGRGSDSRQALIDGLAAAPLQLVTV